MVSSILPGESGEGNSIGAILYGLLRKAQFFIQRNGRFVRRRRLYDRLVVLQVFQDKADESCTDSTAHAGWFHTQGPDIQNTCRQVHLDNPNRTTFLQCGIEVIARFNQVAGRSIKRWKRVDSDQVSFYPVGTMKKSGDLVSTGSNIDGGYQCWRFRQYALP